MENKIISETFRNNHPFEVLMDSGKCTKSQLQSWICNRYYFQKTMVSKDAIISGVIISLLVAFTSNQAFLSSWSKSIKPSKVKRVVLVD